MWIRGRSCRKSAELRRTERQGKEAPDGKRREPLQTVKKAAGRKSSINEKEIISFRLLPPGYEQCGWPLGANAFAFCVVRLLPYPYTPTEAHSLPLQPFRQPPSLSKTMFFDKLKRLPTGNVGSLFWHSPRWAHLKRLQPLHGAGEVVRVGAGHARRGACSGKYRGERVYACRGNRCEYAGRRVCTGCVGVWSAGRVRVRRGAGQRVSGAD